MVVEFVILGEYVEVVGSYWVQSESFFYLLDWGLLYGGSMTSEPLIGAFLQSIPPASLPPTSN